MYSGLGLLSCLLPSHSHHSNTPPLLLLLYFFFFISLFPSFLHYLAYPASSTFLLHTPTPTPMPTPSFPSSPTSRPRYSLPVIHCPLSIITQFPIPIPFPFPLFVSMTLHYLPFLYLTFSPFFLFPSFLSFLSIPSRTSVYRSLALPPTPDPPYAFPLVIYI